MSKRMKDERLALYEKQPKEILNYSFNLGEMSPICEGANGSAHELLQALQAERLALQTIASPAIILVRDSHEPEAKHDKIRFQNLKAALVACGYNVDWEGGDEY